MVGTLLSHMKHLVLQPELAKSVLRRGECPIGCRAAIDTGARRFEILESAVDDQA